MHESAVCEEVNQKEGKEKGIAKCMLLEAGQGMCLHGTLTTEIRK